MGHGGVAPKFMPFHLLEEMTDRFSEHRSLGSGSYGKVYMVQFSKRYLKFFVCFTTKTDNIKQILLIKSITNMI